ncbi:hypothetical protein [Pseudorhodoferax sp. Leaf267]|uniref:hypothetical protein n=1 Tax=Pseudorhodoferax sp. Leaf267 TaxID=1736316 RepID=UPI0012E0D8B9|nr:hypothetical protein [Pseudorhodoferax sp. Leaf267]
MAIPSIASNAAPTHPQSAGHAPRCTTADFSTWLRAKQQAALDGMRTTTGAEFTKHCDAFQNVTTAINVLWNFEVETDMAAARGAA